MIPIKYLHAADLHLDAPFQSTIFFDNLWINRLEQSTWKALDNLINLAICEQVDFVILSGDIFDQEGYREASLRMFIEKMHLLCMHDIYSFIILGNHDLEKENIRAGMSGNPYIHLFADDEVEEVIHYKQGRQAVKIYGRGYWEPSLYDNPSIEYINVANSELPENVLKIAVAHGRVGEIDDYLPCSSYALTSLKNSNIDYWAMGHVHKRKGSIDTLPLVANPGKTQGSSIDETGAKGCYIVSWYGKELLDIRFESLEVLRWEKVEFDCKEINTNHSNELLVMNPIDEITSAIKKQLAQIQKLMKKPIIIQLLLKGQTKYCSQLKKASTLKQLQRRLTDNNINVFDIEDQTTPRNSELMIRNNLVLREYILFIEKAKKEQRLFSELEEYLQTLYGDSLFQSITETSEGQRGRGQWKQKKLRKEWLLWLDQAIRLGLSMPLDEIWLHAEQEKLLGTYASSSSINSILLEYKQVYSQWEKKKNNQALEDELVFWNRLLYQVDGELFNAVKEWTIYKMALWALKNINSQRLDSCRFG